jgi:alpha-galactosidase
VLREKIVIIGAGSAVFTRGLLADLLTRKDWDAEVALVDIDPEALVVAEGLAKKMIASRKSSIRLSASVDRREVLSGATAVICTIAVGKRRAWEQDVFIPRRHGIYQPVGDSVLPGGTSRAMRMIPAMVDIAHDVLDLAPDALFFNYGNPMAPVCRAVRKATGARVVGLCHGVFDVGKYLARVLKVPEKEVNYTCVGMNHMTWFTEFRHQGRDVMPELRRIATDLVARSETASGAGERFAEAGTAQRDEVDLGNPFCWRLLDLFGGIPSALDRHVTEFFPHMFIGEGAYYGKTLGVDAFSFEQTIQRGDASYEKMRQDASGDEPLDMSYLDRSGGEHEQVLDIIESIRRDDGRIYSANLPNAGQAPNLPAEAIIEAPAAATCGTLRPLVQKPLPPAIAGTLATRLHWVETVVDAALEGDRDGFVRALVLDGAVDSLETARTLADEFLTAHAEYLPQF